MLRKIRHWFLSFEVLRPQLWLFRDADHICHLFYTEIRIGQVLVDQLSDPLCEIDNAHFRKTYLRYFWAGFDNSEVLCEPARCKTKRG
ncbi:hypothetical protein RLO149_c009410 [Roseobacter litoralis Och 149]|uniref:Uncharacterized protein n=1 Tax=Roseobacter litoralis (strain ATCC 49566 / DSM 6996 / JCM 21268 / NBRC 15278 / OCh 149) TaxID=391595 RepID=F7ZAF6_ROSLO|nr:hypothetical protein RLO149_c009410 [Roseobacter litoralis Och 149]